MVMMDYLASMENCHRNAVSLQSDCGTSTYCDLAGDRHGAVFGVLNRMGLSGAMATVWIASMGQVCRASGKPYG